MPSRIQLLRFTAALPVIVPAVLYGLVRAMHATGHVPPTVLGVAFAWSFSAIWGFGLPYLALVFVMFFALRHRPWTTHRKAVLAAPWLMVVAAEVFAFLTSPEKTTFADAVQGGLVIAVFCVAIGYVYVILALLIVETVNSTFERRKRTD